eukprot:jgi/Bigna1/59174/fgenesh1_kg.3_\
MTSFLLASMSVIMLKEYLQPVRKLPVVGVPSETANGYKLRGGRQNVTLKRSTSLWIPLFIQLIGFVWRMCIALSLFIEGGKMWKDSCEKFSIGLILVSGIIILSLACTYCLCTWVSLTQLSAKMQPKFFVVIDSIITINIGILNATRFFAVLPRSGSTCV